MLVSYRQLNGKAGQLADILTERGVKPGKIVAIMAERSVEMIIGILAILKAGGGYVPLADGRVRPDVPLENYVYYRQLLAEVTAR